MTNKVLLVEDEAVTSFEMETKIQMWGYDIIGCANSGDEALKLARDDPPNLVLMDVRLKGDMDGIQTTKILKKEMDVAIIYVTAHSEDSTMKRAQKTDPYGYLIKPFDDRELKFTMEMALYKHNMDNLVKNSEERYRVLVESTPDAIFIIDLQGKVTYLNQKSADAIGKPMEKVIGRKIDEFYDLSLLTEDFDIIESWFEKNETYQEDVKSPYPGVNRWWNVYVVPQRDLDGKIESLLCIGRDVTQRIKQEEQLRQTKKEYKHLYLLMRMMCDNVPDMIWAKDKEHKYIFANKAICTGLLDVEDTSTPLGQDDFYFSQKAIESHPENSEWYTFGQICHDSDQIVLDTKKPLKFFEKGNVKGSPLHLEVYKAPFWDDEGDLIGTVGCAHDVTEAKEVEDDLIRSEESYRELVDACPVGVFKSNSEGELLFSNPSLAKILGFDSPEDLEGINIASFYPHASNREVLIKKLVENKKLHNQELQLIRKDGEKITTLLNAKAKGNIFCGVITDITNNFSTLQALMDDM